MVGPPLEIVQRSRKDHKEIYKRRGIKKKILSGIKCTSVESLVSVILKHSTNHFIQKALLHLKGYVNSTWRVFNSLDLHYIHKFHVANK